MNTFTRRATAVTVALSLTTAAVPATTAAPAPAVLAAGADTAQPADHEQPADQSTGQPAEQPAEEGSSFAKSWNIVLAVFTLTSLFSVIGATIYSSGALDGLLGHLPRG